MKWHYSEDVPLHPVILRLIYELYKNTRHAIGR